MYLRYNRPT